MTENVKVQGFRVSFVEKPAMLGIAVNQDNLSVIMDDFDFGFVDVTYDRFGDVTRFTFYKQEPHVPGRDLVVLPGEIMFQHWNGHVMSVDRHDNRFVFTENDLSTIGD